MVTLSALRTQKYARSSIEETKRKDGKYRKFNYEVQVSTLHFLRLKRRFAIKRKREDEKLSFKQQTYYYICDKFMCAVFARNNIANACKIEQKCFGDLCLSFHPFLSPSPFCLIQSAYMSVRMFIASIYIHPLLNLQSAPSG